MKEVKINKQPELLTTMPGANSYTNLTTIQLGERIGTLHQQITKINAYIEELHRVMVYDYNYDDVGSVTASLPETREGALFDTVLKYRGHWDPQLNEPLLLTHDETKKGWLYIASNGYENVPTVGDIIKGDIIFYSNDGVLTNFSTLISEREDDMVVDMFVGRATVMTDKISPQGHIIIDGVKLKNGDLVLVSGHGDKSGLYLVTTNTSTWSHVNKLKTNQVVSIDKGTLYGGTQQKKADDSTMQTVKLSERATWEVVR